MNALEAPAPPAEPPGPLEARVQAKGETICYTCAMKDEEGAKRQFEKLMNRGHP